MNLQTTKECKIKKWIIWNYKERIEKVKKGIELNQMFYNKVASLYALEFDHLSYTKEGPAQTIKITKEQVLMPSKSIQVNLKGMPKKMETVKYIIMEKLCLMVNI